MRHAQKFMETPAANDDLAPRLRRLEERVAELGAGMQFLIEQAQEQRRFRTRIEWAVFSAVFLLILQALGLSALRDA